MRRTLVSTTVFFVCLAAGQAFAQAQAANSEAVQVAAAPRTLKEIVVSGSRSEQDRDELPMTVEVIDAQDIEERQILDIRDAAESLPNVTVPRAPARFTIGSQTGRDQNQGFNIRGLDGNRVLMLVDGIRQPRSYLFPSESAVGRDYLDMSLFKRVEIVKGPTSALYGSDGVAGLVNFITKDPEDYLRGGKPFGGSTSLTYSGDTGGWTAGATLAGRANDTLSWLVSASGSRADELDNKGTNDSANLNRTTPNPERDKDRSLLAKIVLTPGGGQRHIFTAERVEKRADYNLLSNIAAPPYAATSTIGSNANTAMDRTRVSYDGRWQIASPMADELRAVLAYQDTQSDEYFFQDRFTSADRSRNTHYSERSLQGNVQAIKTLRVGDAAQKITYGLDHQRTDIRNLQTGVTPPAGETYPLKRFPDTTESATAFYAQDEFLFGNWSVTPGVRFDHYSIDADQTGYSGVAQSMSGSAVSPKLGALYRFTPEWSAFANYAGGFRAPTAGEVNGFFTNPIANYRSIANPNLRPEKSRNLEVGARGRLSNVSLDAAAFTGRFKDFIESFQQVSGSFSPVDPAVFQAINRGNVRISGFEIKGNADWGRFAGGTLTTPFSYGRTNGRDTGTNTPINSIAPAKARIGVAYDTAAFKVALDMTHYDAKKLSDIDKTSLANPYASPSATVFDLTGQWRIKRDLRLTAGVYNLTDRKYWRWADVVGQASNSTTLDAYTQPGRYVRVSLVADF